MNKQLVTYGSQFIFSLAAKGSFLLITILIFKALPKSEAGIFAVLYAIATILATVSECGLRGLLVREMSRITAEPKQCKRLIAGVITARLWTLLPYCILLALSTMAFIPMAYWPLAGLIGLAVWFDSNGIVFRGALRAFNHITLDAFLAAMPRVALLLIAVWLYFSGNFSLENICIMLFFVSLADTALALAFIRLKAIPTISYRIVSTARFTISLIKRGIPFTALAILGIIYLRAGLLLIGLAGDEQALAESAAFSLCGKLPEGVSFLPIALMNVAIPYLARNSNDYKTISPLFSGLEALIGTAGIIISAGLVFFASDLILLLGTSNYAQYKFMFQLYGITVFFSFIQYLYANLLLCMDKEHRLISRYGGILVLNVFLNLVLIWQLGAIGAVVSLLVCEIAAVMVDLWYLRTTGIPLSSPVVFRWIAVGIACVGAGWIFSELDGLTGLISYGVFGATTGLITLILLQNRLSPAKFGIEK